MPDGICPAQATTATHHKCAQVSHKLDMKRVIEHGKEKGVGLWLYVNQHALMKQMDELFPLLKEWGVAGVKSGFVQYASHRWAAWLHDMVRKAADNKLMMNIHDEFRPSGFSRTFPNLLTQEGIGPAATTSATMTRGLRTPMLISLRPRSCSTVRL